MTRREFVGAATTLAAGLTNRQSLLAAAQTDLIKGVFAATPNGPVELIAYADRTSIGLLQMSYGSFEDVPAFRSRIPRPLQPAQLAARAGLAVDPNGFQRRVCRTAHPALCRAAAQHLGARTPNQRHGRSGAGEEAAGVCPGHRQQSSLPVHHALDRWRHPRLHGGTADRQRTGSRDRFARPARRIATAPASRPSTLASRSRTGPLPPPAPPRPPTTVASSRRTGCRTRPATPAPGSPAPAV